MKLVHLGKAPFGLIGDSYSLGQCSVILTRDAGRWHLSIAHPRRYPTWDEIHEARYTLLPSEEIFMAMITPPKRFYVNLHPNCFHLWEMKDKELIEIVKQK